MIFMANPMGSFHFVFVTIFSAMDIAVEQEEERSLETPLLEEDQRVPWEPPRSDPMHSKMNYFRRLQQDWVRVSPPTKPMSPLTSYPPSHILPPAVFVRGDAKEVAFHTTYDPPRVVYQSAWSTIFSIWNTMIGSTLVALPYGFSCSGILLGIGIVILMGVICCHTCHLVVAYGKDFKDFGELTQYHFGRRVQLMATGVSLFVLVGACIAYHVLMKQCAFSVVSAVLSWTGRADLEAHWTPSAAAIAILLLFPLANLKEFSTLVLLNSFGIPFVLFTIAFIVYHGVDTLAHEPLDDITIGGKSSFGVLGGIVTLSFFIHNAIQPIVRDSNPRHHRRQVSIAYALVGLSYTAVGALGYVGFPHNHVQQNFLDAFPIGDVFAFSARASLLMQLATVYPLVLLIVRTQLFGLLFQTPWPGAWRVMGLNAAVMTLSTMFAVYYPNVGDVLRFTGAIGGFVLIFCVPIGIHLVSLRAKRQLTKRSLVAHCTMVWIGLVLLILQFVPIH
ncbi:hypothetical protein ACHHYP_14930 [Achlya hypogyna]|uniref:Amino acid transporter transmembrane domain-containing protein n=1 Tax=Achlya hypogyna TaxID=1202772 RepID=A0A1V9YBZ8_ACHHY|nr:hypothetical protein ACHHYP_14930 [Achlya hypogyna]